MKWPGCWEVDLNWLALVWRKWTSDDKLMSMSCSLACSCGSLQGYRRCTNFEAVQVQGVYILLTWICATVTLVWGSSWLDIIPSYQMLSILMNMFLYPSLFQELSGILPGRWPTERSGCYVNGRNSWSLSPPLLQIGGTEKFAKVIEFLRKQIHRETLVSHLCMLILYTGNRFPVN